MGDHEAQNAGTGEKIVAFHGDGARLSNLVFWNTVAAFLTFGLYRFWARTRLREHYWHRITVAGSPAEYLGRGSELFGGFAVVFVFLAVLFAAVIMAGLSSGDPGIWPLVYNTAVYGFVIILLPVALYRARRYRLSRTLWRGIRMGQGGNSVKYGLIWFAWLLACIVTLGLAYPWRNVAAESYRVRHTRLGNAHFSFGAKGSALLAAWLPAWAVFLGLATGTAAMLLWLDIYLAVSDPFQGINSPAVEPPRSDFYAISPAWWAALTFVSLIGFFFAYIAYRVREFRYFVSCTRLGEAHFHSRLQFRDILAGFGPLVLGVIGYAALSLALVLLIISIVANLPSLAAIGDQNWFMIIGILLVSIYVIFLASYGVSLLFNLRMRMRVIGAIASSLSITGIESVDSIEQDARNHPRTGEGLADAFQFGNF